MAIERRSVVALLMAVLLVGLSRSTPTAPFRSNTTGLPTYFCYNGTDGLMVSQTPPQYPESILASAQFNASADDIGWDFLRVRIHPRSEAISMDPNVGYYAAGFAEGFLTAGRIVKAWVPQPSPRAQTWIKKHLDYLSDQVKKNAADDDMWSQVGKLLFQLQGLADGYMSGKSSTDRSLDFVDMFLINFGAEVGDVEIAVRVQGGEQPKFVPRNLGSHCSALVKVTDDDLFVAHDTWSGFGGMSYRMYKVYDFCPTVVFSGHPAFINSMDDWYQTSNQLAVQETTNDVFNQTLYHAVVPETVSEFLRVMAANFLAGDAESWTTYFSRHNSGTYNNQYMVVDFKQFAPGASLPDTGIMWIAEQIPGFIYREDVTKVLKRDGYWASYNIPYSYHIFEVSGYKAMEEAQGTFWSYTKYARPEIFRRNQSKVTTVEDVQRLMRYNDYKNDPFSIIPNCTGATNNRCSPDHSSMLTIASRGDLMPVYNTSAEMMAHYGPLSFFVAQGCFGAIDCKIASYKNRHTLTSRVISGPTNDQVPTFTWGTPICGPSPGGPTVVDFPWVEFDVAEPPRCNN
jgi:hypothetical protein